jgi:hypothetical protein
MVISRLDKQVDFVLFVLHVLFVLEASHCLFNLKILFDVISHGVAFPLRRFGLFHLVLRYNSDVSAARKLGGENYLQYRFKAPSMMSPKFKWSLRKCRS